MTIAITGLDGIPEVHPGDDLADVLARPLRRVVAAQGDVVAVTSKIVSKAEGRLTTGDRATAIGHETAQVVARRGDLVIARTRHGFVCANAGVDASNVDDGSLALLPTDPDASAARLRDGLQAALGLTLGVVITDTFGRPWRRGLVNVAIGCAGLPGIIDLRGRTDDRGRTLDATVVALADEVAAASGLVMAKDARIPAALVRGVDGLGAPATGAATLVRPPEEDLFPRSPLWSLASSRDVDSFGSGGAPTDGIEDAIEATMAALDTDAVRIEVRRSPAGEPGSSQMLLVWATDRDGGLRATAVLPLAVHAAGWASRPAEVPDDMDAARSEARVDDSWTAVSAFVAGPPPDPEWGPPRGV